jgi:CheY-like chemotaxis protein
MGRRILLADDSLTIQKVVELTFADTDYEVVSVSSGDELIEQLPTVRPKVVICDVIMPGRDGYEICQEIKSHPDYLHLPVILLTGTFEPFDRERALAAGCSEIVTKPFEARRLMEAVERLAAAPASAGPDGQAHDDEADEPSRVTPPPPIMPPEDIPEEVSFADLNEVEDGAAAGDLVSEEEDAHARNTLAGTTPAGEEALDFSTSGFFEMEAAGEERRKARLEEPSQGLEFDVSDGPEAAFPDETDPFVDRGSRTAGFTASQREANAAGVPEPAAPPAGTGDLEDPFAEPSVSGAADTDGPFGDEDSGPDDSSDMDRDLERERTTPIDVAAVMGETHSALGGQDAGVEDGDEAPAKSNVDTQDFAPKPRHSEDVTTVGQQLSEADIDRIARRVLELAGERIEAVAWEVIPDMAEIVVRERIREIESEAKRHEP